MRILLTGATGQIGRALVPLFQKRAELISPTRADFDLSKPAELADKLHSIAPDLIVNPAAYTAVDNAEDEPQLAFRVNAYAPAEMAEWAARRRVPLVHFSTDYVFDGSGSAAWREDSPTGPLSVYGRSKLAGDLAILEAGGIHLIARTSWVYAAAGANFVSTITRLARERQELRVVADQIGAPTSANAIAGALARMIPQDPGEFDKAFERSGVVNVVCTGETSWHGFAEAIVGGLRSRGMTFVTEKIIPIPSDQYPARAKRPANSRLDLSRLRDEFAIRMPSWQQALDHELDLMRVAKFRCRC